MKRQPEGSVSAAQRNRALEQLLRILFAFMYTVGATPREIRAASTVALRNVARRPYRMAEAQEFEILRGAADLLAAWYSHAALVDEVGVPLPLPRAGTQSVESLVERYLPDHPVEQVIDLLLAEGILTALPNGHLRPLRRTAILPRLNGMTLDRMAILLQGLLGTVGWNYRDRGGRETRLERQVHATHLPVELLPEFEAMVKQSAGSLIDRAESWLASRQSSGKRLGRTARAGVSLFSYVEENDLPASRRVRRSRARK
ncbi:MAG: hypothetical protein JSS86_00055 [Cyanobacteria bacterium SZAS LIN-2]|nr:hypothetical protein [Cyanobacteria bacterium SZAS LIN-2]